MAYERLNLTDGTDKWKAEHVVHLEDGILANEEAIASFNQASFLTVETITIGESGSGSVAVTGITLDYTSLSLTAGESIQIAASVSPSDATNTNLTWLSSDTSVVTVKSGYVTAIAAGNATITVVSAENSSIKATCAISVAAASGATKVLLGALDMQDGLLKKDASTTLTTISGTYHVQIPYIEGMLISTALNSGWVSNYPPVFVVDGGAITVPEYTQVGTGGANVTAAAVYNATLTGFSDDAVVWVNIYALGSGNVTVEEAMNSADVYYYTYEA